MNDHTDIVTTSPAKLALVSEVESAGRYMAASKAPRTVQAYRAAWEAFEAWTRDRGMPALPSSPAVVATYLAHRADEGAAPASLNLYLSAIVEAHRAAKHDAAAIRASAEVRAVMAGIKRTCGTAQRQAAPLTPETLRVALAGLDVNTMAGARDRALLLLGFAAALRRSELVALDVAALTFSSRGMEVRIARSKTDQQGEGHALAIPFASSEDVCPVRAVQAWLALTGITSGPVLRSVDRWGSFGGPLDGRDVARIVKRAATLAGVDPERFSGHSLRAGLATAAALAGKSDRSIMAQGRWRGRSMVDRYVRAADAWRDNASKGLL